MSRTWLSPVFSHGEGKSTGIAGPCEWGAGQGDNDRGDGRLGAPRQATRVAMIVAQNRGAERQGWPPLHGRIGMAPSYYMK